ncbi:hypothetical protein SARC_03171 [Sphaeroforma arctica JP610]|uniref:Dynactin subunit 3 n=1 Tax=Sphaeroforma arctica JP610 TaxID=667725 RepID=A0A0L0G8Q2_9EUKA|nr:hypothetical protein SARC_03171 [Sphaeroforma arctica JP610]KNC84603.1 hypothetical protein SARC_03171 [Sphaeroforma arctica JP610]|eukprot:XP_014158505.1 hypothetical protein SARC_03171 [Sphaeroforma arctica JP610]
MAVETVKALDTNTEAILIRLVRMENAVYGSSNEGQHNTSVTETTDIKITELSRVLQKVDPKRDLQAITTFCQRIDRTIRSGEIVRDDAKLQIVLASIDDLHRRAALVTELQTSVRILDENSAAADAKTINRLHDLARAQPDCTSSVEQLSDRVEVVLREYNEMVNLLSEAFIRWDDIVREAEKKYMPRRS